LLTISGLRPRSIEINRVVCEEIKERGTVSIRRITLFEQFIVAGDWDRLELVRLSQRLGELGIDLRQDLGQIPSCDIFALAERSFVCGS
jgi:hypothetical protein